ncbi:MAG: hypothetical protein ACRQFF_06455 [Sphaerochaeta sp.]
MVERRLADNLERGNNFSHALTIFTIATTVACLFAPIFETGMTHQLESQSKDLESEKQNLIEQRNKLLSDVSKLQSPESIYDIAVENDYKLTPIDVQL